MLENVATWLGMGASAATIGAAIVAVVTLVRLKRDSQDRTRPRLSAELRAAVLTQNSVLVVKNVGMTAALNVRTTFEPALPIREEAPAGEVIFAEFMRKRYAATIPTLSPGTVLRNIYQNWNHRDENLPDDFTIRFEYQDEHGRRYGDRFDLTEETLLNETISAPSTSSDEGRQKRLVVAVEQIAESIGVP